MLFSIPRLFRLLYKLFQFIYDLAVQVFA